MSMDLYLWKAPVTDDPDEAGALVDRCFDQRDETMFEPSADIARYADALRALYPDDPDLPPSDDCPWSDLPFSQSDRLLILNIRWSAGNKVLDDIVRLARDHDLVIYDPQGPSLYLPDDPIEPEPIPEPTLSDWLKVLGIVAFFAALTFAAWQIPIGWLRWIAVAIGIFFTIAALIIVYAMLTRHRELPE